MIDAGIRNKQIGLAQPDDLARVLKLAGAGYDNTGLEERVPMNSVSSDLFKRHVAGLTERDAIRGDRAHSRQFMSLAELVKFWPVQRWSILHLADTIAAYFSKYLGRLRVIRVAEPAQFIGEVFAEQGFYLARAVYENAVLRELEEDFDRIVAQLERSAEEINARWSGENMDALDGGTSTAIHTHSVHRYSSRWLRALQHETFLHVTQQILGTDIVLHHTKLFQKPPREGAPFPIHQDWWYFPTRNDSMIAAVIFLTDADQSSGGLCVYPGSHKLGRLENSSGLDAAESLRPYPLSGATPVNAKRGDVLFFSYFTLHGSLPNKSEQCRKTVLVQMHSGGDYVLENEDIEHINERLVLSGWNHHMRRSLARK